MAPLAHGFDVTSVQAIVTDAVAAGSVLPAPRTFVLAEPVVRFHREVCPTPAVAAPALPWAARVSMTSDAPAMAEATTVGVLLVPNADTKVPNPVAGSTPLTETDPATISVAEETVTTTM